VSADPHPDRPARGAERLAADEKTSRLRLLAFSRVFVVVYGVVFLGGLILVIVAFAMM